jgi:HAE1 family hydrophobic/amphiphilic exporter-1
MLLTVVIGLISYFRLPVELFPNIALPTISVTVPYPGAGPQSVADQVARPVENALNTISGVNTISSISSSNVAQIVAEFDTGVDLNRAEQSVREQVNAVLPTLPPNVQDPIFQRLSSDLFPVLALVVSDEGARSPLELRTLLDTTIVPRLQRIDGVGAVNVSGGQVRQINVQMDLARLQAHQIAPAQIVSAIQSANTDLGLGNVTAEGTDISLRVPTALTSPEDITRVQLPGTSYSVGDVASVEDGVAEVTSYARLNGEDAIRLDVRKQSGTNTITVVDSVFAELERLATQYGIGYTVAFDTSTFVRDSTRGAIEELIVACIAAMLVVLLFFRDLRNTLVTVIGMPVILIGTFAVLQLFGMSINIISLLALSLSVGLVIDDAIVVRENIFRRMERGESPIVASSRGTAQVALSVVAMSLTIIAVFLPVTFTGGIVGVIFAAFGVAVAGAVAISMVEAFTLAPMLSAYLFKGKQESGVRSQESEVVEQRAGIRSQEESRHEPSLTPDPRSPAPELPDEAHDELGPMERFYERVLRWCLRRRMAVVGIAVAVLIASGFVAAGLQFAFFPALITGEFAAGFEMPPGTALDQTDALARQAEAILLQDPAIESVQTTVGGGSVYEANATERGEFFIRHEGEDVQAVQARLREQLGFLPLLAFSVESAQTSGGTAVTGRQIQLSLQSTRPPEELTPVIAQLQEQMQGISGLTDINTTYKPGRPELRFELDPSRTGDLGLSNDQIATSVRALIEGEQATTLRQGGEEVDIVVQLRPEDRAAPTNLEAISVPTAAGNVPLGAIARVELASGPTTIRRYNQLNQVIIGANVSGRNLVEAQGAVAAMVAAADLPDDVVVGFVGESEQLSEGFTTLFIAMGLSVLFVYMVLASQFSSFLQPLVIMLAMPFSFIGAFAALRIAGIELDTFGLIGLIMLMGLVVKNSILLVDFTNQLRNAGMDSHPAIERAGALRLRPILMTTLSLIAGAIPVAIGLGEGAELRRGLSVVLIGGLITSTLLTLLVVPVAYSVLESFTRRASGLFQRQTAQAPSKASAAEQGHSAHDAPAVDGQGKADGVEVEERAVNR